ncbi:uracil-DNA glycosylase [Chloroflexota bacterium]
MSALSELHKEITRCQRCQLAKYRTQAVPGEGADNAEIMFIGEAPGRHEDLQGRPFVGPAGQYLNQLLTSVNLDRCKVYITNIVKSRPPGNRDPSPAEISACCSWLEHQISLIHPKIIVTLGRYSMAMFFPNKTIGAIHGTAQKRDNIIYFAMYHPAAALHQQNLHQTIEEDMRKIPLLLTQVKNIKEIEEEPRQLNMF